MNKYNIFSLCVITAILSFFGGAAFDNWYYNYDDLLKVHHRDIATINAYEDYSYKCEVLLDSIAKEYPSFNDVIAETDTYSEYIDSREFMYLMK